MPDSRNLEDENKGIVKKKHITENSKHVTLDPTSSIEEGQNSHNMKDISNVSNLTSYEFESKILKNNYKEYLGGTGGIKS